MLVVRILELLLRECLVKFICLFCVLLLLLVIDSIFFKILYVILKGLNKPSNLKKNCTLSFAKTLVGKFDRKLKHRCLKEIGWFHCVLFIKLLCQKKLHKMDKLQQGTQFPTFEISTRGITSLKSFFRTGMCL